MRSHSNRPLSSGFKMTFSLVSLTLAVLTASLGYWAISSMLSWTSAPERYHQVESSKLEVEAVGDPYEVDRYGAQMFEAPDGSSGMVKGSMSKLESLDSKFEVYVSSSSTKEVSQAEALWDSAAGVTYNLEPMTGGVVSGTQFLVVLLYAGLMIAIISAVTFLVFATFHAACITKCPNYRHRNRRSYRYSNFEFPLPPTLGATVVFLSTGLAGFIGFRLFFTWISSPHSGGSALAWISGVGMGLICAAAMFFLAAAPVSDFSYFTLVRMIWPNPSNLPVSEWEDITDAELTRWLQRQRFDRETYDVLFPDYQGTFFDLVHAADQLGPEVKEKVPA